ncbi:MAG: GntR family transcriptional regulator [Pseudomonadota bacterium]
MKSTSPFAAPTLTLHSQVRETLRASIADGSYAIHARLPAESVLSTMFGVSRITVRQALSDLQHEGAIVKVAGKGAFVAPRRAHQQLTHLEGFAEAMSRFGHEVANTVLGHAIVAAPEPVARQLQLAPGAAVTQITRVRRLDCVPVSLEVTYVAVPLGERLRGEDLAGRDIFVIFESDYNIALGHADLQLDATLADADVAHALEVVPGSPILRIERLTHDALGAPIDFEYLHFRGDAFQYRLQLARRN